MPARGGRGEFGMLAQQHPPQRVRLDRQGEVANPPTAPSAGTRATARTRFATNRITAAALVRVSTRLLVFSNRKPAYMSTMAMAISARVSAPSTTSPAGCPAGASSTALAPGTSSAPARTTAKPVPALSLIHRQTPTRPVGAV